MVKKASERSVPLVRMADGTTRQVSPLTGAVVWSVPTRAHRPQPDINTTRIPLDVGERDAWCAFCAQRYLETTPEKVRIVGGSARRLTGLSAEEMFDTVAQFRRFGNLYPVLSTDYWQINHGSTVPSAVTDRAQTYLATAGGRAHIRQLVQERDRRSERGSGELSAAQLLAHAESFLAASHDVIVAQRHVIDAAQYLDELAGPGTLTVAEHSNFFDLTVEALADLHRSRPEAVYVVAFQNWLPAAGATFDHLHKQVLAVDEYGPLLEQELRAVANHPEFFNTEIVQVALRSGLVVAANDGAVAMVGFGHPYPTLEVYSTSSANLPWEHSVQEQQAMSELVHAVHVASGSTTPSNEEWHYRPVGVRTPLPWRVAVKWRGSTPAGLEGSTGIFVSTVDPWTMRDEVVANLQVARQAGLVGQMRLGSEVTSVTLRYVEGIQGE